MNTLVNDLTLTFTVPNTTFVANDFYMAIGNVISQPQNVRIIWKIGYKKFY